MMTKFVSGSIPAKIHVDQNSPYNIWYAALTHADLDTTYQFLDLEQLSMFTEQPIIVKESLYDASFQTMTPLVFILFRTEPVYLTVNHNRHRYKNNVLLLRDLQACYTRNSKHHTMPNKC
jgi:hypothetical protein